MNVWNWATNEITKTRIRLIHRLRGGAGNERFDKSRQAGRKAERALLMKKAIGPDGSGQS